MPNPAPAPPSFGAYCLAMYDGMALMAKAFDVRAAAASMHPGHSEAERAYFSKWERKQADQYRELAQSWLDDYLNDMRRAA